MENYIFIVAPCTSQSHLIGTPTNVFNNVILARNRQLPDDDRMIETCRSIFKSFNANNLSVCIGWCADQLVLWKICWCGLDRKRILKNGSKPLYLSERQRSVFFFASPVE